MNRTDRAAVRRALAFLPSTCRYHGEKLERPGPSRFLGQREPDACCDTGAVALAKRRALAVLDAEAESSPD